MLSSNTSDPSTPTPPSLPTPVGTQPIPLTSELKQPCEVSGSENLPPDLLKDSPSPMTSDQKSHMAAALFLDLPLDSLMDLRPEQMGPEALAAYVQRCSVLRASAQSRKAALNAEATTLGATKEKKKAPKKDSVSLAMDLLKQLTQKKA